MEWQWGVGVGVGVRTRGRISHEKRLKRGGGGDRVLGGGLRLLLHLHRPDRLRQAVGAMGSGLPGGHDDVLIDDFDAADDLMY